MKVFFKYFLALIIIVAGIAFIYWENYKKQIIKSTLQTTVGKKTDSLYSIHYDSSGIDEINGNASFYNVRLQPDSSQMEVLKTSGKLPGTIFNIHVNEVKVVSVNVPGLLSNETISARAIYIKNPIVLITNTGTDTSKTFTAADTLAVYQQILGKFKSIKADTIKIIDGEVAVNDKDGNVLTSFKKVNISLHHFLVDSTHDYSNIVSYFIKDVQASVEELKLPGDKADTRIVLSNVAYDAAKKSLAIQHVRQYNIKDDKTSIDINKIAVDGLNTNNFILRQQLKATSVTCDGGVLTIVTNGKAVAKKGDPVIELSDNFFDQAQVDTVNISNTKIIIVNKQKPDDEPFELNNVKFSVSAGVNISDGNTLSDLINNAHWKLSSDGFSFNTKNGNYKISVGSLSITNDAVAKIMIDGIHLKPLISETAYGLKYKQQRDLYNFDFNNIVLTGVDIKGLISDSKVEMTDASVQPMIRIFNDRTLPADDTSSRFGTYPHQALVKLQIPFYIKNLHVVNGFVSYREKGSESGLVGNLIFNNLNGVITNVTNIPEKIAENSLCILNIKALFLDKANFTTKWIFPLNTKNGSFKITSHLDSMNGIILNPVVEPLGLMSIKDGQIDKLDFDINGNDYGTTTNLSLLYHKLDMDMLKKKDVDGEKELKKKGLASFVANIVIKNQNPEDGEMRKINGMAYKRNIHNPFFFIVWTSIFTAAKKITLGQKTN
jgi:hypothetical protein